MSEKAQTLIEEFSFFDDWEERYQYMIDLGKNLPAMADADKHDGNKLSGCVSQVWMVYEDYVDEDGKMRLRFYADSDAILVKGLISLLFRLYQDETPDNIMSVPIEEVISAIGLASHLSVSRRNGFQSMIAFIRQAAT